MALTKVGTDGIKDDAVTLDKQAANIDGKIITYDANGHPVAVGPGSDGQVLTSTGAGSSPAFEDVVLEGTAVKSTTNSNESSNKFLRADGDGTCSWQTVPAGGISDVVSDTSPQLGGDLDTNSFEISLDDDHKVKFGDGTDLKIYHDSGSSNSYVENDNANGALILTSAQDVEISAADDWTIHGVANGQVELYHDGTKKFETNANGVSIYGNIGFVSAGQGIDFGATANAANSANRSELLDDYEQGTWSPTLPDSDGGIGSVSGWYTKVGQLVAVQFSFVCLTNSDNSGFKIAGFPYTNNGQSVMVINSEANQAGDGLCFVMTHGQAYGHIYNQENDEKAYTNFSNCQVWGAGTYITSS